MKKLGKKILCSILEWQVRRLRQKNSFSVVAVAGSMGKTSTKLAVAAVLGSTAGVRYQKGNYNDRLTVPLIFFGHNEPGIFNVFAWLKILWANERQLRQAYPYDYVVVELGTDAPGQLHPFAYLTPELVILTAIAPEHMEFFGSLDAVAEEELVVTQFAKQLLVNADDVPEQYRQGLTYLSYGLADKVDYGLRDVQTHELHDMTARLQLGDKSPVLVQLPLVGRQGAKVVLAAAAAADIFGYDQKAITKGMEAIRPVAGRMQILTGKNNSTLIDDTYNASPPAVKAALDVLVNTKASQRIAILGSMNELGNYSEAAHREVGTYCGGKGIDLVVTIGAQAKEFLAPAASAVGCQVASFASPYEAGDFVAKQLKKGAVVLAKGSQNGVFAEEALKPLLVSPTDINKLVRQSAYWLSQKQRQFPEASRA